MPINIGIHEILLLSVVPVLFVLWLWALLECLMKESREGNTRIVWVLVILLAPRYRRAALPAGSSPAAAGGAWR